MLRVLCHVLINCLPEEGLPTLYENLTDLHSFYKDRSIHVLAPAPALNQNVRVNVGRTLSTQPFDISED